VTHYAVPNMASAVARTASLALTWATLPYVARLAGEGVEGALGTCPGLGAGVYVYRGVLVSESVGRAFGVPAGELAAVAPDPGAAALAPEAR
jgi:alanine dehydrogenase